MKHPTTYISDHLLVVNTLAFIVGIVLALRLQYTESLGLMLGFLLLSLVCLVILQLSHRHRTLLILLPLLSTGLGCFHTIFHLQPPGDEQHIFNRVTQPRDLLLIGTMATMEKFDGKTSQIPISVEMIQFREGNYLEPAWGKVLVRLQGGWPEEFLPGDKLAIRVELKRPASYRTPGGFDYAQYLARNDIWITGFIRSPGLIEKVDSSPSLLSRLRYLPERTRAALGRHLDQAVKQKHSAMYRAVLLGDRSRLDETTLEAFKGSGTMHILAISGMHVAVAGFLLYTLFYYLLGRSEKLLLRFTIKKWAAFLSLPIIVGYGFIAGMNTPVFRAVIMSSIVIIAICADRRKFSGPLLAFAALLILTFNPLQLFSTSFQLSFVAVAAILFLLPTLQKLLSAQNSAAQSAKALPSIVKWLSAALLVSFTATLATAPISINAFNRLSITGPVANLAVEPLICFWSLPAGFLAILCFPTLPMLSTMLLRAGCLGLSAASSATAFFSSLPLSSIWLPSPPAPLLVCYYLFWVFFVIWSQRTQVRGTIRLSLLVTATALFSLTFNGKQFPKHRTDFRVSYLDVGQGSASLVQFSSGYTVLVDGGGSSFGSSDVGERVIGPFLWEKGISRLDLIAVTHPDADHYNGLFFILKHFSPKALWIRDKEGHDDNFRQLIRLAENMGIPAVIPEEEQKIGTEREYFACVANTTSGHNLSARSPYRNPDNSGLVLKACYQDLCVLFPGDIEEEEEKILATMGHDLKAEFLLAPHHGSSTSSSAVFLEQVAPVFMVVSAGSSASGRFPHPQVHEKCNKRHITMLTTARHGTLELRADMDGFQLYGFNRPEDNPLYPLQPVLLQEGSLVSSK
ncbi:MAG: DNA internalization-related competence protein ComEC/Rec2 [Desulforhopalus sp.]